MWARPVFGFFLLYGIIQPTMGKINVHIDGGSGTGKSTIAKELSRLGYSAIDSDIFCYNGDPVTGIPVTQPTHETWIWDKSILLELLNNDDDITFICGGARNRDEFMSHFDIVFELVIDEKTIRHRILGRTNNDWGKKPGELEKIIKIHRSGIDRQKNAIQINANKSLKQVLKEILTEVEKIVG